MIFLIVLVVATALATVFRRSQPIRDNARLGLGMAMAFAGLSHLFMPTPFVQHLPEWVPVRTEIIYFTGIVEILFGAALVWPARWRQLAGLALAAYLASVFPSNVYVAVEGIDVDGQPGGVYPWLRLPFQALFIGLALWSTDALQAVRDFLSSAHESSSHQDEGPRNAGRSLDLETPGRLQTPS